MQTIAFETTQVPVVATMMSTTGELKYHAGSSGGEMPTPPADDDEDEAQEEPEEK